MKKLTNIAIVAFLGLCFNCNTTAQKPQAIFTDYNLADYDLVGKIKSITTSLNEVISAEELFNEDGNMVKKVNNGVTDSLTRKREYSYNAEKKLLKVTVETRGVIVVTDYEYDKIGRLLVCNANKTGEKGSRILRYDYDDSNRVIAVRLYQHNKALSVNKIEYDAADRIVKNSQFDCNKGCDKLYSVHNYSYTEKGQLLQMNAYSGGSEVESVTYTYNDIGQLISKKMTFTDPSMELNSDYFYNKEGRIEKEAFIGTLGEDVVQDQTYLFEYDQQGNWIKKTSIKEGEVFFIETRVIEYY